MSEKYSIETDKVGGVGRQELESNLKDKYAYFQRILSMLLLVAAEKRLDEPLDGKWLDYIMANNASIKSILAIHPSSHISLELLVNLLEESGFFGRVLEVLGSNLGSNLNAIKVLRSLYKTYISIREDSDTLPERLNLSDLYPLYPLYTELTEENATSTPVLTAKEVAGEIDEWQYPVYADSSKINLDSRVTFDQLVEKVYSDSDQLQALGGLMKKAVQSGIFDERSCLMFGLRCRRQTFIGIAHSLNELYPSRN